MGILTTFLDQHEHEMHPIGALVATFNLLIIDTIKLFMVLRWMLFHF